MYVHIYTYVAFNFLSPLIFVFLFFFLEGGGGGSMITNANEVATSSTGFPRLSWTARARDKRNRGIMGMSVKRERGSDGKEKKRLFLPFPSLPSSPLSLIINSNIPQKVIASDWGRGR